MVRLELSEGGVATAVAAEVKGVGGVEVGGRGGGLRSDELGGWAGRVAYGKGRGPGIMGVRGFRRGNWIGGIVLVLYRCRYVEREWRG